MYIRIKIIFKIGQKVTLQMCVFGKMTILVDTFSARKYIHIIGCSKTKIHNLQMCVLGFRVLNMV